MPGEIQQACSVLASKERGSASEIFGEGIGHLLLVGFLLRRSCNLSRVLVILTFEGAIRVGMLMSLVGMAWRQH